MYLFTLLKNIDFLLRAPEVYFKLRARPWLCGNGLEVNVFAWNGLGNINVK